MRESGVYQILNVLTGDSYVGSSSNLAGRESTHKCAMRKSRHANSNIQKAYDFYGAEYLDFYVLEKTSEDRLIEREQFYMDSIKPSYNIAPKAGTALGTKHSEERKKQVSEQFKGEKNPWFGVTGKDHPLFGRKHLESTKKIISEKNSGSGNPMYGVTPSHAKLSEDDVRQIRVKILSGMKLQSIADEYGVSKGNIAHIKQGRSYRGVI